MSKRTRRVFWRFVWKRGISARMYGRMEGDYSIKAVRILGPLFFDYWRWYSPN